MSLSTRLSLQGSTIIKKFAGGGSAPIRFGKANNPGGLYQLIDGTGATGSNVAFIRAFTLAAGANQDIDLTSGETDPAGAAVLMTAIKWYLCELTSPAANAKFRIGPQGVTNAIILGFQAATTNFWEEGQFKLWGGTNWSGITVDSTHKVIRINNPTGSSISGYFACGGVQ